MANEEIKVIADKEDIVAIADKVRTLDGVSSAYTINGIADSVEAANSEINVQAAKIAELSTILDGKAAGGGGSGGVETCTVTISRNIDYGAYLFYTTFNSTSNEIELTSFFMNTGIFNTTINVVPNTSIIYTATMSITSATQTNIYTLYKSVSVKTVNGYGENDVGFTGSFGNALVAYIRNPAELATLNITHPSGGSN